MSKTLLEQILDVLKDAPLAGAGSALVFGLPLHLIVWYATAFWAVARVVEIILNIYWKLKDRREQSNGKEDGRTTRGVGAKSADNDPSAGSNQDR